MYFKFKKVKNKTTYINPFHIFAAHLLKTRSKVVLSIRESFKMQLWQVASGDQVVTAESGWASKELMDLIEAVPYYDQFIRSFEEMK